MESNKPSRTPASLLWWLAFAAEAIAAILETVECRYLQAAGMYCLALAFLLLATGGVSDTTRWRKRMIYLFVLVSMGLLLYRLLWGKGN
jgi:hypothetical protein